MENTQIAALLNSFDDFVQLSLERKASQEPHQPNTDINKVENYRIGMEKRLKLKPPSQQDRFQKMLAPMKDLKSFVSVKQFMEKLGTNKVFGAQPKVNQPRLQIEIKQQYETARGGYYLKRIEDHLRRHNYRRQSRSPFFTDIQNDPICPSEFKTWMEDALYKISPRQQSMFRHTTRIEVNESTSSQDCLMEQHKKNYHERFKVVNNIHNMCTQQYEQFTKISSLLTNRLRKLLKTNCTSRASKVIPHLKPNHSQTALTKRNPARTSLRHRQKQQLNKNPKQDTASRVKTAGSNRKEQTSWRQNLNNRFRLIVDSQDQSIIEK